MSGLPQFIPLQSVPIAEQGKDGKFYVDFNWYLFFYSVWVDTLGKGGGSTPVSPSDLLDMVDIDAAQTEVLQAYRQIVNGTAIEAQDVEIGNAEVPRIQRDVVNTRVASSLDAEVGGADIASFARLIANAQLQLPDADIAPTLRDLANAMLFVADMLQMDAALVRSNNLSELTNASAARSNLGLGTIATQNANAVAIAGGTIDGAAIGIATQAAAKFTTAGCGGVLSGTQWGTQGVYFGWNYVGGNGEADFINSKGGGVGGFNFYNVASSSGATPSLLASLDSSGDLTVSAGFSMSPTTTTTTPAAGGAGALPSTPAGYATVTINGTARKIAYY